MAPEGNSATMHREKSRFLQVLSPILASLAPWMALAVLGLSWHAAHAATQGVVQAPGEVRC